MSLDHRFSDESTAFDFDWSAEPAQSGANDVTDDCSILSLTMDRRASRAFANLVVSTLAVSTSQFWTLAVPTLTVSTSAVSALAVPALAVPALAVPTLAVPPLAVPTPAVSTWDDRRMASTGGPDENPRAWLEFSGTALEQADPALVLSLRRAAKRACPVIVLRGLPVTAAPPPTPYDGSVDLDLSRQAIVNLHAVAASLGLHPIAYAGENASTLHAVCPTTGARGQASSRGFDAALPFHTDYADRPIDEAAIDQSPAAAALLFAVERAEPATPMQCVPLPRLLSALSAKQIRIACAPEFAVAAPDIFGGGKAARVRRLLLGDTGRGFRCRLNLGKMTGCTARAARLLLEIHEILSDGSLVEQIHVRRGDIVVMDNQRAIHRRGVFTPRWDGADRYFIRMSAARDARAGIAADPSRPWLWS